MRLDELKKKLANYEKAKSIQLSHRDSRTLDAARKRVPKRVKTAKQELVYHNITLSCVFGGRRYNNKRKWKETQSKVSIIL